MHTPGSVALILSLRKVIANCLGHPAGAADYLPGGFYRGANTRHTHGGGNDASDLASHPTCGYCARFSEITFSDCGVCVLGSPADEAAGGANRLPSSSQTLGGGATNRSFHLLGRY